MLIDFQYPRTFRFFMPTGRQFILQASDESSINDWIAPINYASAFKSAGVQMRGLGMSYKDIEKTGVAAAASHLQDLRASRSMVVPTLVHNHGSSDTAQHIDSPTSPAPSSGSSPRPGNGFKLLRSFNATPNQIDLDVLVSRQLEGYPQYKATFDEVKAELAAHDMEQFHLPRLGRPRTLSMGTRPKKRQSSRPSTAGAGSRSDDINHGSTIPLPSRSEIVQSHVDALDDRINRLQRDLDLELRVVRNLAILTPFQRATRDRVQLAVVPLAKKIRVMRIDLARLVCYRFVLLTDLAGEEREWEQAKRDALKAANRRLGTADVQRLPGHDWPSQHSREEPSAAQSFYTAFDGQEGSPQANASSPVSLHSENDNTEFPLLPVSDSKVHQDDVRSPPSQSQSDLGSSPGADSHERFYSAVETSEEIAAAWNETRAAKRVSLVMLPSDYKLPIISRQVKRPGNASEQQ